MQGFNLNRIKELNKLSIWKCPDGEPTTELFSAYCSTGYSINNKVTLGDAISGTSQLLRSTIGKVAAQQLFNISGGISMDRIITFEGTSPYSLTFQCFLTTDGNYESNVLMPLERLTALMMPHRDDSALTSEKIKSFTHDKASNSETLFPGVWSKINQLVEGVFKWTGEIYTLAVPPQLQKKGENSRLGITYGNLFMDEIIITDLKLTVPQMMMESKEGFVYPDHVKVDLTIETKRNAQLGLFDLNRKRY